ncbi:flavin-binding monooxygenase [Drechmeria coniospora]|uniref:Flavin-binding monooxygenase n=1 Tax=Drechmeria coniospora TaxID=98403 RepID=A0A151GK50_DRECN|nr:flavin-binding monooxygenase [Drechmeria coniospora]KYK57468.1 flavin-binding monooxygenase [Drechmeria coniospora]ODA79374.1 hypothetical protein RJ55_04967 [Drechmeria coniospora]
MHEISEHHDIVILGAGLSGINTAHVLREKLPHRKVTILEARSTTGGTWNFFRYPGFRSDSYMSTFGLRWFPWPHDSKMASGPEIAAYLEDAARDDGCLDEIRFRHKVTRCEWRDEDQFWTLDVDADGEEKRFSARFLFACTGYYSYEKALEADIPGIERFQGTVAHPQWWPKDLDYRSKRVVIIGSGATAYTMVPAMADDVASVTMLQRSPSYAVSVPTTSTFDRLLRLLLPAFAANWFIWWKDLGFELLTTQLLLRFPNLGRRALTTQLKQEIPKDVDADVHFNPRYNPFQQRLCMCPDGDFFKAMHRDNVEVVTDVVDTVTADGILLQSGRRLDADIIVTATGLYFQILDGMHPVVNGVPVDPGAQYTWRGGMLESLPNAAFIVAYVTQSWTPGADVMAKMVVRVLRAMESKRATKVVPVLERYKGMPRRIAVDANSNYFLRAADRIPKVTGEGPWYGRTHWMRDIWALWFGSMEDGLVYSGEAKKNT